MDYDLIARLAINEGDKQFKRIPEPLACFRRHASQKTQNFDQTVLTEHKYIANKLGFQNKYTLQGKIKRYFYRFRRLIWYLKRAGVLYTIHKFLD